MTERDMKIEQLERQLHTATAEIEAASQSKSKGKCEFDVPLCCSVGLHAT